MKFDIKDLTFIIPIRVDSIIRLENLLMCIQYLLRNFETNIIVLEASDYNNGILGKLLDKRVEYLFVEDKDPVFYRTRYLNLMTQKSATPFIGIWDADVIIPKEQIMDAVSNLREGYEIAYPYSGFFYETSYTIRELFLKKKSIDVFLKNRNKMELPAGDMSVGGAFMVNKAAYVNSGMENTNFYGWGSEDTERYYRWAGLGYKIYFSQGCLFHLTHPRGSNSTFRSQNEQSNSQKELMLTQKSSKEELEKSIRTRCIV
jgi:predicted glycosyltransferase involved in capsule biosynthesis